MMIILKKKIKIFFTKAQKKEEKKTNQKNFIFIMYNYLIFA